MEAATALQVAGKKTVGTAVAEVLDWISEDLTRLPALQDLLVNIAEHRARQPNPWQESLAQAAAASLEQPRAERV